MPDEQGEAPDTPEGRALLDALSRWQKAASENERQLIWHEMLRLHAENVFTIGVVNATKQPVA
ncbi:MAG: hypothetical protein AAFO62_08815, partial [Pseudomonadota bacterium]